MGSVFVGTHLDLGHEVAVKVLHPHLAQDSAAVKRFVHEAKVCASLHHPNVVTTIDFGRDDAGVPYIVMEYLVGQTLASLLNKAPILPPGIAVEISRQLISGVAAIHEAGIRHRDIKPSNIFLIRTSGTHFHVKLVDFGVAKTSSIDVTREGSVIGTPSYMSPEALFGTSDFSATADLYAVGLVMHRMLGGELPFESSDPSEMAKAKLMGELKLFERGTDGIPQELQTMVRALLHESPKERPSDAKLLVQELESIQRNLRERSKTAISEPESDGSTSAREEAGFEQSDESRDLSKFLLTMTGEAAVAESSGTFDIATHEAETRPPVNRAERDVVDATGFVRIGKTATSAIGQSAFLQSKRARVGLGVGLLLVVAVALAMTTRDTPPASVGGRAVLPETEAPSEPSAFRPTAGLDEPAAPSAQRAKSELHSAKEPAPKAEQPVSGRPAKAVEEPGATQSGSERDVKPVATRSRRRANRTTRPRDRKRNTTKRAKSQRSSKSSPSLKLRDSI